MYDSFSVPVGRNGQRNPTVTNVVFNGTFIIFRCLQCGDEHSSTRDQIDQELGLFMQCSGCKTIYHIPGSFRYVQGPEHEQLTAGVRVPIGDFSGWFICHPIIKSNEVSKDPVVRECHAHYGFWTFCESCSFRFRASVLLGFLMLNSGAGDVLFNAHSQESARQFDALKQHNCPSCDGDTLIVIITEVPNWIIERIREKGKF